MKTPTFSRRWVWIALAIAAPATMLIALPRVAAPAYLAAFVLTASIPLGAAALLMLLHASGGLWADPIRPRLQNATALTPFLGLVFIPIAFVVPALYSWAHSPDGYTASALYFRPWFVAMRAICVLLVWGVGGPWLAAASRSVPAGLRAGPRLCAASAAGLILYVLTVTFAFTDWVASLEPRWTSSMFGVIIVCSQGLTALAFVTAGSIADARRHPRATRVPLRDLGTLILAFALLHAYVVFSQFFIIWNGDVPERTAWYVLRIRGIWLGVLLTGLLVQFAVPFAAMLFQRIKASPPAMLGIAVLVLFGAVLEAAWTTLPSAPHDGCLSRLLYLPIAACLLAIVFGLPGLRVDAWGNLRHG